MQICRNEEEYNDFLDKYRQVNPQIVIDTELVNALSVIVEFDVMSIEVSENVIILPIPYDTNFKYEIECIHEKIKNTIGCMIE